MRSLLRDVPYNNMKVSVGRATVRVAIPKARPSGIWSQTRERERAAAAILCIALGDLGYNIHHFGFLSFIAFFLKLNWKPKEDIETTYFVIPRLPPDILRYSNS